VHHRTLLPLVLYGFVALAGPTWAANTSSSQFHTNDIPLLGQYANTLDEAQPSPERDLRRHQLRSWRTMWQLVQQLPRQRRPRSILYVASGIHLAPLVLCEALPRGVPCRLEFTELNGSTAGAISDLLGTMATAGVIDALVHEPREPGVWHFSLNDHRVELRLRILSSSQGRLISPELLDDHDMVISHDWAGDPVSNLGVIYQLLLASRETGRVPLLMIEDLQAHPYPIDLDLFGVAARCRLAYGHRSSGRPGQVSHSAIELGAPVFGGAVVLSFDDPWWARIPAPDLENVLNLLIFDRFGWSRRNVLATGPPPVVPSSLLDWWTGFGARTVEGKLERPSTTFIDGMVRASVRAAKEMGPTCRAALCKELEALRSTIDDLADGKAPAQPATTFEELDASSLQRNLQTTYRKALRQRVRREKEREQLVRTARKSQVFFQMQPVVDLLRACHAPVAPTAPRNR